MIALIVFLYGLCLGSFANVLIWRLLRGQSIQGRSMCPHCGHKLIWSDLLPLLSFIFFRGKCRYCSKSISLRYPLIEFITGALFAVAAILFPPLDALTGLILIKSLMIVFVGIIVFVIDLEHYLILNKIVFPAAAIVLVIIGIEAALQGSASLLVEPLLSALSAFGVFWLTWFLSKGKWMGLGDVKFAGLMGLMLGWPGVLVALMLAFVVGALVGMMLMALGRKQLSSRIPFGTFLSAATIMSLLFGTQLWEWYRGLINI